MVVKIEFDAERHLYRLNDQPAPGCTRILTGLNLVDDRWFTEESRQRGSAVHAAVHYWLEGALDWESVDNRILGYVEGAIKLIEELKLEIEKVEHRVGSEIHGFCGMLDFRGKIHGEPTILDWKSGPVVDTTGYQLSGYEIASREEEGQPDRFRRIGVQLHGDGTFPKPRHFTKHTDERRFLAALDLYRAHVWPRELKYGIASSNAA
jgi:hypothetical protein